MQRSHSEAVSHTHDLAEPARSLNPGRKVRWGGLLGRRGFGWTLGGWETRWGMVRLEGSHLRMHGSPAGAAQGLWADPAGLLTAQKQCNGWMDVQVLKDTHIRLPD